MHVLSHVVAVHHKQAPHLVRAPPRGLPARRVGARRHVRQVARRERVDSALKVSVKRGDGLPPFAGHDQRRRLRDRRRAARALADEGLSQDHVGVEDDEPLLFRRRLFEPVDNRERLVVRAVAVAVVRIERVRRREVRGAEVKPLLRRAVVWRCCERARERRRRAPQEQSGSEPAGGCARRRPRST